MRRAYRVQADNRSALFLATTHEGTLLLAAEHPPLLHEYYFHVVIQQQKQQQQQQQQQQQRQPFTGIISVTTWLSQHQDCQKH